MQAKIKEASKAKFEIDPKLEAELENFGKTVLDDFIFFMNVESLV